VSSSATEMVKNIHAQFASMDAPKVRESNCTYVLKLFEELLWTQTSIHICIAQVNTKTHLDAYTLTIRTLIHGPIYIIYIPKY